MVVDSELYYQISRFLAEEASLLDQRQFREWIDLLANDVIYRMPLRVTRDPSDGPSIIDEMTFFEEDKLSLTTRVNRLGTTSAWAESPPSRTRHYVTNILVEPGSRSDEVTVRSNFLVLRSRGNSPECEQIFGERIDVLRRVGDRWSIAARTIYPDQSVIGTQNFSIFL